MAFRLYIGGTRARYVPRRDPDEPRNKKLSLRFNRSNFFLATVQKEQKLWVTKWLWFEHERMGKALSQLKSGPRSAIAKLLEKIGRHDGGV